MPPSIQRCGVPRSARPREFVGGYAAALYAKNTLSKTCDVAYEDGRIGPYYTRLYLEKYASSTHQQPVSSLPKSVN
jgi:hypothetical protein